jgi:hypothetical protein
MSLMQSGDAPILHVRGEKPVALIFEVVALDIHDQELTRGLNRISIRNRSPTSGSASGFEERSEPHTCEHLQRGHRRAASEDQFPPPHETSAAKWSEHHADRQGIALPSETWEVGQRDWRTWASDAAAAAGRHVFESHGGAAGLCENQVLENDFDFPVLVMNLRHRTDKRLHMERLLCELGFTNVSFPATTRADDLDIASLILAQAVSTQAVPSIVGKHGMGAPLRCHRRRPRPHARARCRGRAPPRRGV